MGLLKKIFKGGKGGKHPNPKDANPAAAAGAPSGGGSEVAAEATPAAPQSLPENEIHDDGATLETQASDHSGGLRTPKAEVKEQAPVEDAAKTDEPPSAPILDDAKGIEAVGGDAEPTHGKGGDADEATDDKAESPEPEAAGDDKPAEKDEAPEKKEEADEKKPAKKTWAEERMAKMYAAQQKAAAEKPKVAVHHEFSAERRKFIENLSSPKHATSHAPEGDLQFGKLSDRMKFLEKKEEDSPGAPKETPGSPSREQAAAKRRAVEDMLKKQTDPNAFIDSRGKEVKIEGGGASAKKKAVEDMLKKQTDPNAFIDSRGKEVRIEGGGASAKKKAVEEMLQKSLDPKAFIDSHGKPAAEVSKEQLAAKKKWVTDTLEQQNSPKAFLDKRGDKHTTTDITLEDLKVIQGHKKGFQESAKKSAPKVEVGKRGNIAHSESITLEELKGFESHKKSAKGNKKEEAKDETDAKPAADLEESGKEAEDAVPVANSVESGKESEDAKPAADSEESGAEAKFAPDAGSDNQDVTPDTAEEKANDTEEAHADTGTAGEKAEEPEKKKMSTEDELLHLKRQLAALAASTKIDAESKKKKDGETKLTKATEEKHSKTKKKKASMMDFWEATHGKEKAGGSPGASSDAVDAPSEVEEAAAEAASPEQ